MRISFGTIRRMLLPISRRGDLSIRWDLLKTTMETLAISKRRISFRTTRNPEMSHTRSIKL